jgi:hypothetical protein
MYRGEGSRQLKGRAAFGWSRLVGMEIDNLPGFGCDAQTCGKESYRLIKATPKAPVASGWII